jgi:short-subunit dehydrogenase
LPDEVIMSKVVLITGASEGIGRATAFAFARHGAKLVIAARTAETLKKTAIALEQELDAEVLMIPTDVTEPDQVKALVDAALHRFGQVDILINNAGLCMSGPFSATTLQQWQQIMNVNFWGYLHLIEAVLPHFLQRSQGQIINVGSFGGKMPLPGMTAYCASKYAVTGLTETLRLELGPQGIEVIGIHPGVVKSNFLKRAVFVDEIDAGDAASTASPTAPPLGSARAQIHAALNSVLVNQPEEVAAAILEASVHHKTDVVVGAAQLATGAYSLFPGLLTTLLQNANR